jgi:hypothetical protein
MFVGILKVYQDQQNRTAVEFYYTFRTTMSPLWKVQNFDNTDKLAGNWVGTPPQPNNWYDVEIEFGDELMWSKNIYQVESNEAFIKRSIDNNFLIQGYLRTDYYNDGYKYATIKIGPAFHYLKFLGNPQPFRGFVQIRAKVLVLYDTNTLVRNASYTTILPEDN